MQKHERADVFRYIYEEAPDGRWRVVDRVAGTVLQTFESEDLAIRVALARVMSESPRQSMWEAPSTKLNLV
jgi:hypothetical protein